MKLQDQIVNITSPTDIALHIRQNSIDELTFSLACQTLSILDRKGAEEIERIDKIMLHLKELGKSDLDFLEEYWMLWLNDSLVPFKKANWRVSY